jgi:peroxiredoxin
VSVIATAADFALPDTSGETHRLSDLTAEGPVVVVFTCNHCPYARAWHDRLADIADDYAPRGVHVLFVNSNDGERYPADSLDAMRRRVAEEEWTVPYLHDESQQVAREFGAETTPDVFVVDTDMQVRYHGAPDQDHEDPSANGLWVREALDDVLSGIELRRPQTEPVGCSIKWRA